MADPVERDPFPYRIEPGGRRVPADQPTPDELGKLTKDELVEVAEERGVDTEGTKADIIARLV